MDFSQQFTALRRVRSMRFLRETSTFFVSGTFCVEINKEYWVGQSFCILIC